MSKDIRETVRARYAAAAREASSRAAQTTGCCGGSAELTQDADGHTVFGGELYDPTEAAGSAGSLDASLGCGVPTAVADLHPGEAVLDLGSGAGGDVLISARRVAPGGRAIGLDMTLEMVELARHNAAQAGVDNVEFVQGYLEDIPLPANSVDVVISNCVINLAADKAVVLREAARVLRSGGRLAISDVIADADMDDATRADMRDSPEPPGLGLRCSNAREPARRRGCSCAFVQVDPPMCRCRKPRGVLTETAPDQCVGTTSLPR